MNKVAQKVKEFTDRRKTERERTKERGQRRFLLSQIDEFRERAKHLQELLVTKASRIQELQDIVAEREDQAKELTELVEERQDAAERIVAGVAVQIDSMVAKADARLSELNETFAERMAENAVSCSEQNDEVRAMIEEQNAKLTETVQSLNGQFDGIRNEICEKVHNENVKCYRNMQALLEESDKKTDALRESVSQIESVKGMTTAICIFAVLNLIGIAVLIASALGVV